MLLVVIYNEFVIQVNKYLGEVLQDMIFQPLKCHSSDGETEWHLQQFEQAKGDADHRLVNVLRHHWKLVIIFLKVYLVEDLTGLQLIYLIYFIYPLAAIPE